MNSRFNEDLRVDYATGSCNIHDLVFVKSTVARYMAAAAPSIGKNGACTPSVRCSECVFFYPVFIFYDAFLSLYIIIDPSSVFMKIEFQFSFCQYIPQRIVCHQLTFPEKIPACRAAWSCRRSGRCAPAVCHSAAPGKSRSIARFRHATGSWRCGSSWKPGPHPGLRVQRRRRSP